MEANELMIGDWADFASELGDQPIAKIITVNDLYMIDNGRMVVRPIPLTPEILEKNGLANDYYGSYFKEDEHMLLEISSSEDGISWTINFHEYGILKLEYVHELQHALRLCRVDKGIVL